MCGEEIQGEANKPFFFGEKGGGYELLGDRTRVREGPIKGAEEKGERKDVTFSPFEPIPPSSPPQSPISNSPTPFPPCTIFNLFPRRAGRDSAIERRKNKNKNGDRFQAVGAGLHEEGGEIIVLRRRGRPRSCLEPVPAQATYDCRSGIDVEMAEAADEVLGNWAKEAYEGCVQQRRRTWFFFFFLAYLTAMGNCQGDV